jgi:hypothetical protein
MWGSEMERPIKRYPTVGACGLDCGLCTRYYAVGKSRCPGCCGPDFFNKHPTCAFITCCVKKKGLEVCGECPEFPCSKFKSQEEYEARDLPSYPPSVRILPNLHFIQQHGIQEFVRQQRTRIRLLEKMIADFDDGRSRSCFCRACALLDPSDLEGSLREANRRISLKVAFQTDINSKAKLLRGLLNEAAASQGIELGTRKPREETRGASG